MKKFFFILILCSVSPALFGGSSYSFQNLDYQTQSQIESQFDEFGKVMGQIINGSVGHLMNMDFFKAGLSSNFIPNDKTGVFQNSSSGNFFLSETLFAGISLFGFNLIGQVGALPQSGNFFAGATLGYQIPVLPILTVTPFISYKQSIRFERITSIKAFSAQVQAKANIEAVNPYATLGFSYTTYETDIIQDDLSYYTHNRFLLHSTLGVRVMFFFYELSITPVKSHTIGVTIDF